MAESRTVPGQHGGARTPDRKPRPPAGPGKLANRQDMGRQGVYTPGGLPYGDRARFEQAQRTAPLPNLRSLPAPASPSVGGSPFPGITSPAASAPAAAPGSLLDVLLQSPANPSLGAPGAQAPRTPASTLALKVDAYRYLATLPTSGPEIQTLLANAEDALAQAQQRQLFPAPAAPIPEAIPMPTEMPQLPAPTSVNPDILAASPPQGATEQPPTPETQPIAAAPMTQGAPNAAG